MPACSGITADEVAEPPAHAADVIDMVMNVDSMPDVRELMRRTVPAREQAASRSRRACAGLETIDDLSHWRGVGGHDQVSQSVSARIAANLQCRGKFLK